MAIRRTVIPELLGSLFGLLVLAIVANIFPSRYRLFSGHTPDVMIFLGLATGFPPHVAAFALALLAVVFALVVAKRAILLQALSISIILSLVWIAMRRMDRYGVVWNIPYLVEFGMMLWMVFTAAVGVGTYLHFLFGSDRWQFRSIVDRYRGKKKPFVVFMDSSFVLLVAQLSDIASGGGKLLFFEGGIFCIAMAFTLDLLYHRYPCMREMKSTRRRMRRT